MKITKLPDVSNDLLRELLEKSVHTVQDLLEFTSSDDLMKTIESELLTNEELMTLRQKAWDIEIIPESADHIDPDVHDVLYSHRMIMPYLSGVSKYMTGKELSETTVKFFKESGDSTVISRRNAAERYGLSEKTINKLMIYIDLVETYEEDREDFYIDFTRSLFTELQEMFWLDDGTVLNLRKYMDTLSDLEDVMNNDSKQKDLIEKTRYKKTELTDYLKKSQSETLFPETPEEIRKRFEIDYLPIMYHILSISDEMVNWIWNNNSSSGTLKDFQVMTKTIMDRLVIAQRFKDFQEMTKISQLVIAQRAKIDRELVELLAEMGDLLNIPYMTPWDAREFIQCGIHSVKDAAEYEFIHDDVVREESFGEITPAKAISYMVAAKGIDTGFKDRYDEIPDPVKNLPEEIIEENTINLSEMLTQLGKGIGQAQRELDLYALEMQKEILRNRELTEYGLTPTWFTMPEIDFSLKMEYSMSSEKTETGKLVSDNRVNVIPLNSKYTNTYKSERKEESILTIKFLPVPPAEAFVQRREIPDLKGMTANEAKRTLAEEGIRVIFYEAVESDIEDEKTEITYQSLEPNQYLGIGEMMFVLAERRRRKRT